MRPTVKIGRRGRSLILALPTLLLLAACSGEDGGGDPIAPPPPDPTVSVTPSAVAMIVGDTASVAATATNTTATPTFTSSDPSVVTVDASGKLTAVGEGTSTIAATAATATATATVTVTAPEPTLAIVGLMQNGQAVDPDNVSGVIDIEVEFADLPNTFAGTIEAVIGDAVIGSTDFSSTAAAVTGPWGTNQGAGGAGIGGRRTLSGSTNAVTVIDGSEFEAQVVNGVHELLTRIPGVAVSPGQQINVDNQSAIALRGLGADRTLVLLNGRRILAGAVTGEFVRINRDGRSMTGLTVDLEGTGQQIFDVVRVETIRDGSTPIFGAGLSDILLPPQGTAGLETDVAFTQGTVTLSDDTQTTEQILGGAGLFEGAPDVDFIVDQVAGTQVLDYDLSRSWYGKDVSAEAFSAALGLSLDGDNPSHVDYGAGSLTAELYYGIDENTRIPFVNTDDIDDTAATTYSAWFKFRDGIENVRWEVVADALNQPYQWGKDGVVPTVERETGDGYLGRRNYNPTADLSLKWSDFDLESGLSGNVWGRVVRYAPDTGAEGEVLVGDDSETGMVRLDASLGLDIANKKWSPWTVSGQVGYLNAELAVEDNAGNLSNTIRVRGAFDAISPTISNWAAPTTYTGGSLFTYGGDVADDVEVNDVEWSLDYGLDWRIGDRLRVSSRFDGDFIATADGTKEQYLYGSVEPVNQFGEPGRTVYPLSSFGMYVADAARNQAEVDVDVDQDDILGLRLSSAYGLADRLFVNGPSSVEVNTDGSENPGSTGDFEVETWTPDIDTYTWSRIRVALRGQSLVDSKKIYLPIEQELTRTVQDNGGWYQVYYKGQIDFTQLAIPKGFKVDGYVAIASDDDGNATISEPTTFQINYQINF